ncbi:hypothetical protein [Elizabethkingia occulta]|uniref:hypothetical protein n=1 Tax=Elizabethkingia occulta TaxID=1867263 RepID=UPI00398C815C
MKRALLLFLTSILVLSCKDIMDDNSINQQKPIANAELVTLKSDITVERIRDLNLFGGDVILSPCNKNH